MHLYIVVMVSHILRENKIVLHNTVQTLQHTIMLGPTPPPSTLKALHN